MAGTILTNIGLSKLAAATPQDQLNITHIAVGDGNGGFPTLSPTMTALTNEVWRGDSSNPVKDSANTNYVYFETNIPPEVGPFDVREIACFDSDGDMIAIGHTSLIQKPNPTDDASFAVAVKIFIALENASDFDLIYQNAQVTSHNSLSDRDAVGAHNASSISTTSGINTQQFIDSFELKIFQSPTDNLTKISTFAGGVGFVYKVRKTSDNSLATIYSDKDGVTEIVQNGTSNVSNGDAEVEFYIADGYYSIEVTMQSVEFLVGNGYVDVNEFGFFGLGTVADTNKLVNAINHARDNNLRLVCKKRAGPYLIAEPVDLTGVEQIDFLSDIDTSLISGEVAITLGGYSGGGGTPDWNFKEVTNGTSALSPTPDNPIIRVMGMKSGSMSLSSCNYLQLHADAAVTGGTSNAYNNFNLNGVVRRVEITGNPGFSWNTENEFHGGRIVEAYITKGLSDYPHNRNFFKRQTFEGSDVDIQFLGVVSNAIYGARFENTTAASLVADSESAANTVERSYTGTLQARSLFEDSFIQITDNGKANNFTGDSGYKFNNSIICDITASSIKAVSSNYATSDDGGVLPDFRYGFLNGGNQAKCGLINFYVAANTWIYLSDLISVENGDAVSFNFDYDGNLLRTVLFVYDENQRLITSDASEDLWSQPGLSFNSGGYYSSSTDENSARKVGSVASDQVKFIRVGLWSSVGGYMKGAQLSLHNRTSRAIKSYKKGGDIVIEGTPTQCYLPAYTRIRDSLANVNFEVTYQHESTLSSATSASGTTVTISDAQSIADGDIVGVLLDNKNTHWSTVSSLSGNSFTVSALPSQASSKNRVVFNRLSTI